MAKNYDQLSKNIVKYVGGESNVNSVFHCATRLRFKVKDAEKVDKKNLEQLSGVIKVMESGGQIQVVIGNHVADVFDAVIANSNLKADTSSDGEESAAKGNVIGVLMDTISGIFAPMLVAMTGAGMLKALLIALTTFGILTADMGTYRILYAASDGVFTFLPIVLAVTAARKFKANEFSAMAIAAALVYPDLTAAYSAGEALTFLGIPVILVSYTSSVIPIIISVYVQSKLEKLLNKTLPTMLKGIFTPLLTLMVVVPASYLVIGPVADYAGKGLAAVYTGIVGFSPVIAGFAIGLIWPAAVMFGVHWGFVPIVMNNIATTGYDTLFVITGPNNMSQAGAALGVFLKTKNKKLREIAGPAALSAVLAGITEPAIYGVTLRFKKPFFIGAFFSGVAGAITAAAGTAVPALVGTSLLSMPAYMAKGMGAFVGFVIACAVAYFGAMITTMLFGYSDDMLPDEPKEAAPAAQDEAHAALEAVKDETLAAPADGRAIALSEVKDDAFASGALGLGAAIIPENGTICAPCDGVVTTVFPTGHAVGIRSRNGAEILIHIGMDTVSLNGKGFDVKVKDGQNVKTGDVLVVADLSIIQAAGLDVTTPVIVTNADDYQSVNAAAAGDIKKGAALVKCEK